MVLWIHAFCGNSFSALISYTSGNQITFWIANIFWGFLSCMLETNMRVIRLFKMLFFFFLRNFSKPRSSLKHVLVLLNIRWCEHIGKLSFKRCYCTHKIICFYTTWSFANCSPSPLSALHMLQSLHCNWNGGTAGVEQSSYFFRHLLARQLGLMPLLSLKFSWDF